MHEIVRCITKGRLRPKYLVSSIMKHYLMNAPACVKYHLRQGSKDILPHYQNLVDSLTVGEGLFSILLIPKIQKRKLGAQMPLRQYVHRGNLEVDIRQIKVHL